MAISNVLKYPQITRETFMAALTPFLSPTEFENVAAAYAFSKYAHRGQERDSGVRYFEHPRAVAWIAIQELEILHWKIATMALLHDTSEDAFLLSDYRLRVNFGEEVAYGIYVLTHKLAHSSEEYVGELLRKGDWMVLLVKLCDRLHNLRTLDACTREKQIRKVTETRNLYLPIVQRLAEIIPPEHVQVPQWLRVQIQSRCDSLLSTHSR